MKESEPYYRRHLPHYQPEGATYHVVFRLAGSIPTSVLTELRFQREQEVKRIQAAKSEEEKARLLRDHKRKYFEKIDQLLDSCVHGPCWLRKPEVASIVAAAMHYYDGKKIDLIAYSIMPTHVHGIVRLLHENVRRVSDPMKAGRDGVPSYKVTELLGSIKKYTALRANRILGRRGAFWQSESYDHVIRDADELDRTIRYVLENPVKAGLCNDWREWKRTYVKPGIVGD